MEGNIKDINDEITHKDLYNKFELVGKDIDNINKGILRIEQSNQEQRELYVTKDQFDPVKKIAYGTVTVILTGVLVAILSLVVVNTSTKSSAANAQATINK